MKLSNLALVMTAVLMAAGAANAATTPKNTVSKKITLTAQINDAIFVSKPDGSTWYSTEELDADDYKQKHFSKVLPIRVWTKGTDFNISLAQPLKMSSGYYEMKNPTVTLSTPQGDLDVAFGTAQKVTQIVQTDDGYDAVYNLNVAVDAPEKADGDTAASTGGSYSGDLVMLFEPTTAAADPAPVPAGS